ncbi:uncharacterized protein LOC128952276 [Oppia nitens]|uniref:uncharacterized protein LOC128952276 n=1 Tax=Oppia nitens TaxID=1686743 RepID=UPI0023DC779A|nr:uncharacterized protein LOC128952276 [Oppia nitens]
MSSKMDINIRLFKKLYNIKIINRTICIIDFIPFIGPIKNASESLLANSSDNSKLARDKGITALVTAAIDLLGLCLAIASIAYTCEKFNQINTFAVLKHLVNVAILLTVVALVSGSKVVFNQLIKLSINNLVGVNNASAAMVNSVTITATGIETIVESVSNTTYGMVFSVISSYRSAQYIVWTPVRVIKILTKIAVKVCQYIDHTFDGLVVRNFFFIYGYLTTLLEIIITITLVSITLCVNGFAKIISYCSK